MSAFICHFFSAAIVLATPLQEPSEEALPKWLRDHMDFMTRDGGRWIADNSKYRSEQEPIDAYGTEWSWGIGRASMTGRLFGLKEGREVATFWEFRLMWHPGKKRAFLYQFGGDGRLGEGSMTSIEGGTEHEQTFYMTDGSTLRARHRSLENGDENRTESFEWQDGEWAPRRSYVWRRERG